MDGKVVDGIVRKIQQYCLVLSRELPFRALFRGRNGLTVCDSLTIVVYY